MHEPTRHNHKSTASRVATIAALGATLVLPVEWTSAAADVDHSQRKMEAHYEQQPPTVSAPVCSSATSCVVPISLSGVSTGDLTGALVQAGAVSRMADGSFYSNSTLVFTGAVTGCGSGKVTMRSTGFNRGGVTSGSIEIIEGSGTGGLASLSGTGTVLSGEVD